MHYLRGRYSSLTGAALETERKRNREKTLKRRADPEKRRKELEYKRQKGTGFSPELVAACRRAQGDLCALCQVKLVRGRYHAAQECADHCHATGQPRGLLCFRCNQGLGFYEKMAKLGAAEYLADPPVARLQSAVSTDSPSKSDPSSPSIKADSIQ